MNPEKITSLPEKPGIYIFKDKKGVVIYVGKAKSLKARVGSYFQKSASHGAKVSSMVGKIDSLDIVVTGTELEAFILESNFIKKNKPRYNIVLRDDKHYPYLKVSTTEDFPKLTIVRRVKKDKSLYFGPYIPSSAIRNTLKQLYKIFHIRQCKDNITIDTMRRRPCLNYQMGRCSAPCAGHINKEDYAKIIKRVILFLKGKNSDLLNSLSKQMHTASSELNYEEAAKLRDHINELKTVLQKQEIVSTDMEDQDIISYDILCDDICIQILFIRNGKITGKREFVFKNTEIMVKEEILDSFIRQYYSKEEFIPDEIIIKDDVPDKYLIAQWLSAQKNTTVVVTVPKRGRKLALIKMATENAKLLLEKDKSISLKNKIILEDLKEAFNLKVIPAVIEAFDISTISGKMSVGSLVVFTNGKADKKRYRRYKIKSVNSIDDYEMMREVISRRYSRILKDKKKLPDLVVVDGGKGQLNAAMKIVKDLGVEDLDIIGIAKGKERNNFESDEFFKYDSILPVSIGRTSTSRFLLQQIRNEAHRFAITFHRSLRTKSAMVSELEYIDGVGKKLRIGLLKHFGSVKRVKEATLEELEAVSGFNKKKAVAVYKYFHHEKRQKK